MPRPRKKVILFLVEGETDEEALLRPIDNYLTDVNDELEYDFVIVNGDVTSNLYNNPDNLTRRINDRYFRPYFSRNHSFYPKDVVKVIHIVDTDGCFIPDENLLIWEGGETVKLPHYSPPYIYHSDLDFLAKRNATKAGNIRYLITLSNVKVVSKTVPYEVYYFSSNMDQCLSGEENLNLSMREKKKRAGYFADANENDVTLFLGAIKDLMPEGDDITYESSWDFITQNVNSLKRYSNLYLGLKRIREEFGM